MLSRRASGISLAPVPPPSGAAGRPWHLAYLIVFPNGADEPRRSGPRSNGSQHSAIGL